MKQNGDLGVKNLKVLSESHLLKWEVQFCSGKTIKLVLCTKYEMEGQWSTKYVTAYNIGSK